MREIKIKICGLKDPSNIEEVAMLKPQFMGFILYKDSPRYVSLKKAVSSGKKYSCDQFKKLVFWLMNLLKMLWRLLKAEFSIFFSFMETKAWITARNFLHISRIIKAFSISKTLPENLSDYQPFCTMFLFDTAGRKLWRNRKNVRP